ncbi:MAG TPA: hypothetical protein VJ623_04140 [Holophagaceae bacterium]|nr:hypothetical protein [Holophagaceae bacterium]
MRKLSLLPLVLLVGLLVACGGGASAPSSGGPVSAPAGVPATGLAYADPVSTGWRLVKDPNSTPTRLLLNLVGPAGLKSRGIGFNLQAPAAVKFGTFDVPVPDTDKTTHHPIKDLGVYYLLNTTPQLGWFPYTPGVRHPLEPTLLGGGLKKGNVLTVGIFQKDRREPAKDSGAPLCQIALEFNPAAQAAAGDVLPLVIPKAQYMAEDVGQGLELTFELIDKAHLVKTQIAVGSLHAN